MTLLRDVRLLLFCIADPLMYDYTHSILTPLGRIGTDFLNFLKFFKIYYKTSSQYSVLPGVNEKKKNNNNGKYFSFYISEHSERYALVFQSYK